MAQKFTVLLSVFICLLGSSARAQKFDSQNLFYITNSKKGIQSFQKHANQISIIVPAAYHMGKHGVITGEVSPKILKIARAHHVKVMPIVGTANQDGIHQFLNDSSAVKRADNEMAYLAKKYNYYGWQLDLEDINFLDGSSYTTFYRKAAQKLHANGFKISMAVVKFDHEVPPPGHSSYNRWLFENWRGAFQIKKLVQIGDFISFMTYDEHTAITPPGPVAGIPWMKKMAQFLQKKQIPMNKVSLGIPTYSDYWYPAWNKGKGAHSTRSEISYEHAQKLLNRYDAKLQWMPKQGVHYAHWTMPNGVFNWLFIEDARSFKKKLNLVPKYGFRGISVWLLGTEDPGIWKVLQHRVNPIHKN